MFNKIRGRIQYKFSLVVVAAVLVVLGFASYIDYQTERQRWLGDLKEQVHRDALIIRSTISHHNSPDDLQIMVEAIAQSLDQSTNFTVLESDPSAANSSMTEKEMNKDAGHEIFILDDQSMVLASNIIELVGKEMNRSMTVSVLEAGVEFDSGTMVHMEHESYFGTLAIYDDDEGNDNIIGAVHLAFPMTVIERNLNIFLRQRLILFGSLTAAILLAVNLVAAYIILRPLQAVASVMRKVKSGDLGVSIHSSNHDELGSLGNVFNQMVTARRLDERKLKQRVQDRTVELKNSNQQLRAEIGQRKQAERELTLAYEETLEGWVRALESRNKETEGHTRRVAEETVRLACAMGINEAEVEDLRRGAMLHDIGKMAIPDSILLKEGPLTEDEWSIMHKHPIYAKEMLSPIVYLVPAIIIPYYHHEKWDGSGYPCGLRGEEIPLPARIFSIVDVWDALLSERPYRKAWSAEKVKDYLQMQAGKHFDPVVVKAFLSNSTFEESNNKSLIKVNGQKQ